MHNRTNIITDNILSLYNSLWIDLYEFRRDCRRKNIDADKVYKSDLAYIEAKLTYIFYDMQAHMHKAGFNPSQPRVPAGSSDGGQWTDGGSGGFARVKPSRKPKPVNDFDDEDYAGLAGGLGAVSAVGNSEARKPTYTDLDGRRQKVPKNVGNPRDFGDHVYRHAKEFHLGSGKDYGKFAEDFRKAGIKEKYPMVKTKEGILKIYHPETNTFGSYNKNGTMKTIMQPYKKNPARGYKYYQRQVEEEVGKGGKVINPLPPKSSGGGAPINPKQPFDYLPGDDVLE